MSLQAKRELLFRVRARYLDAGKNAKGVILDGFVAATGYRRKYAIGLLNASQEPAAESTTRQRKPMYDESVRLALLTVWNTTNQICGKRLVPFLPEIVASLERFGHLSLDSNTRQQLLKISAATVDRIVSKERAKVRKSLSLTKPGGLLKKTIAVKTFSDWNEATPGFFEADLVAHCGGKPDGQFLNTLVLTDIATGWLEIAPLLRRCHSDLTVALDAIRQVMPMPLLGLDTDNGSEFINYDLLEYCQREKITFTRSRPYRKNDQAHVEQKNGNVVRRMVGHDRYEGLDTWRALLKLYRTIRLYVNFFQPSVKLVNKSRIGSKVQKKYDAARTPYQRVLSAQGVPKSTKDKLKAVFEQLDPVALFQQISSLQNDLEQERLRVVALTPIATVEFHPIPEVAEEMAKTLTWNRKQHKRHKKMKTRDWRTRKDPFKQVAHEIQLAVKLQPTLQAKELFNDLSKRHPGLFKGNEERTLRRRVAEIRRQLAEEHPVDLKHDTLLGMHGKKLSEATTMS